MKRTKPSPTQEKEEQAIKNFIDKIPRRKIMLRIPKTKEGGTDWGKFLPTILTERPKNMPFDIYRTLLKEQKKKLKRVR